MKNKNMKQTFFIITITILFMPIVVFGQYYVIGDIPNTGDDGLKLEEEITTIKDEPTQQIIEETVENVTATTQQVQNTNIESSTIEQNKNVLKTTGLLGTVAGGALALASTAIPLFATTPTMMQDLLFLNLFGFLSKKRNKKRWGVVFDSDTRLPIPAVKIVLFDTQGKELETTYSNKDGRFGFLAGVGKYKLEAYKKNYELFTERDSDEIYGKIYNNETIEITSDKVLSVNVALHSTTVNWQEYADKKIKAYISIWSLVKKYLFTSLYIIGFIATILITIFFPSVINISLVVINIILFIFIFLFKRKDHGKVVTGDKVPVPFAVVNLYDENGVKNKFAVTDVIGRYYMLADNGRYTVKAVGQTPGAQSQIVHDDVHVRDGLVDKDIIFK